MDAIVNRPNRVLEKQKLLQAQSHQLVYLRGPRSRLYFGVYMVVWAVGLAGTAGGVLSLIKGKPSAGS